MKRRRQLGFHVENRAPSIPRVKPDGRSPELGECEAVRVCQWKSFKVQDSSRQSFRNKLGRAAEDGTPGGRNSLPRNTFSTDL